MKKCALCGEVKPKSEYHKQKKNKPGLRNECKECCVKNVKQWREKHRDPSNPRRHPRQNPPRRNRVTVSDKKYCQMLKQQKGVCAICGGTETAPHVTKSTPRRLSVDHCHKTKKIRGLLCSKCNVAIGYLKEDLDILASAASYLINSKL